MNNKQILLIFIALLGFQCRSFSQYPYGDRWYTNPLGFKPLELHTAMGALVPAAAVTACLLLTRKDSALAGRLSMYNETGFSWGYKYPHTFVLNNNTGINFMLRRFMSVGVEFGLVLPRDEFNWTSGYSIRPFARFYPVNRERWKLYFESGGGFILFSNEFPQPTDQDGRLGTQWNGITRYGIGAEFAINQATGVMLGVRHLHVSNGNSKGVERNPSHDSNGFFLGLSYRFR